VFVLSQLLRSNPVLRAAVIQVLFSPPSLTTPTPPFLSPPPSSSTPPSQYQVRPLRVLAHVATRETRVSLCIIPFWYSTRLVSASSVSLVIGSQ